MAQGFMPSKKITRFSDVIYSHLERLSNLSTLLIDNPSAEKIYNYELALAHLEALIAPYIEKKSRFEELNNKLAKLMETDVLFIEIDTSFQVSYIKLLQQKLSLIMTVLYTNNLLETKQDSYGEKQEIEEDEYEDNLPE